jgi:hypothetical protein
MTVLPDARSRETGVFEAGSDLETSVDSYSWSVNMQ